MKQEGNGVNEIKGRDSVNKKDKKKLKWLKLKITFDTLKKINNLTNNPFLGVGGEQQAC